MEASNRKTCFYLLASAIAGILVVLSLAPFKMWLLAPCAVAILYWSLEIQDSNKSRFLCVLSYHLALFGFGASWVYFSIHDYGYTGKPLAYLLTFLFCFLLALSNAISFIIYFLLRIQKQAFSVSNLLLFAGAATLVEAARSWMFSGFPWLLLGYGQVESVFGPLATVFGVYGLSLLVYLSGAVLATLLKFRTVRPSSYFPFIFASVLFVGLAATALPLANWTSPSSDARKVSMIQANISQHDKWRPEMRGSIIKAYRDTSFNELVDQQLVIWPEAAIPLYQDRVDPLLDQLNAKAKAANSALVYGVPSREFQDREFQGAASRNSRGFIARNSVATLGDASGIYHKRHLVPFGEYVPFQNFFGALMKIFDLPLSTMRPGPSDQAPLEVFDWQTIPLICYEIVFPNMTARAAKISDVLITVSNDTWFGDSIGPLQHLQMAQMRALENGRWVLRSTSSGVTAIIDSNGKIVEQAPQFERAILRGAYYLMEGQTPWMRFGYWLIHLISAALLIPALISRLAKS